MSIPKPTECEYVAVDRETLRDLAGVLVAVEEIDEELAELQQMDTECVTARVEHLLASNGIRTLSHEERGQTNGQPFLALHLTAAYDDDGSVVFRIDMRLYQMVMLVASTNLCHASTWQRGGIQPTTVESLPATVKGVFDEYIELFADDFLAANPLTSAR